VVRKGAVLATTGVAVGLIVSASVTSAMASMLYGVRPHDPIVFGAAPAVLFAIAFLASYVPARRAGRVDPLIALRES
jgi:ABC-type antimicrobial peptide transport system permease subunit